jgi:hypothetical protein
MLACPASPRRPKRSHSDLAFGNCTQINVVEQTLIVADTLEFRALKAEIVAAVEKTNRGEKKNPKGAIEIYLV